MPWVEYVAHNVTCKCGHKGRLILSSDEWGTRKEFWEGFTDGNASHFNPSSSTAKCEKCGSLEIEIAPEGQVLIFPVNRT